uniref:FH2 domain-containing protein n=1 Tax=Ascaris lumbricoides TaxID=6252 RepID=A0A9J2QC39_ASCLU
MSPLLGLNEEVRILEIRLYFVIKRIGFQKKPTHWDVRLESKLICGIRSVCKTVKLTLEGILFIAWFVSQKPSEIIYIIERGNSLAEADDSGSFSEDSEDDTMSSINGPRSPSTNSANSDLMTIHQLDGKLSECNSDLMTIHQLDGKLSECNSSEDPRYVDLMLVQLINVLKGKTDSVYLKVVEEILNKTCNKRDFEQIMGILRKDNGDFIKGTPLKTPTGCMVSLPPLSPTKVPTSPPPPPVAPPPPPSTVRAPPAPPPPLNLRAPPPPRSVPKPQVEIPATLKPKSMPKEGTKLKQIQWTKIPAEKVVDAGTENIRNVWMSSARLPENEFHVDFEELECMFSCGGSLINETPSLERRSSRKNEQINLLCHKRSFNVSIFIKQFKEGLLFFAILFPSCAAQVVNYIREGRADLIGLERLNSLIAILPDSEETEILRGFTGDVMQLGPAEQFFLNLLTLTDYKLKLECLILKLELDSAFDTLLPQIDIIITASNEIKQSVFLPKVFCMLVQIGNFLNANGSCGNAAGFKLNSLWKIVDMKATKKSITLLHFIAMVFTLY